jgi:predicted esterase
MASEQQKDRVVVKASETHGEPAVVVMLHGLGDTGNGWAPQAQAFAKALPHIEWILPHAPQQPVSLNGGMKMSSWHDIKSLDNIDAEDFKGLPESVALVHAILKEQMQKGVKPSRMMVTGFSQGGALSLMSGYQFHKTLAGIVCMSGYLPVKQGWADMVHDAQKKTPSLQCHGTADQVVKLKFGEHAHEELTKAELPTTFKKYANLGHSSAPKEMQEVQEFIGQCLPKA